MCIGPSGPHQAHFDDGLRFLATALALYPKAPKASLSAACDAMKCFLMILEAASRHHLGDPTGEIEHLKNQCLALLSTQQSPDEAVRHALEAARLARDQAARLLPQLLISKPPADESL